MLNSNTSQAGYAVATITLPNVKSKTTLYVVVAIHAAAAPVKTSQTP